MDSSIKESFNESVKRIKNNQIIELREELHFINDPKKQFVVSKIAQLGLITEDRFNFFQEVCKIIAVLLETELVKILELTPDNTKLILIAGVGWKEKYVGNAYVGVDFSSQAGYTLLQQEPVIVNNFKNEKRFRRPKLLHEHNVESGISVTIAGKLKTFGILGAHSVKERNFTQDDVNIMSALSNICSATIIMHEKFQLLK